MKTTMVFILALAMTHSVYANLGHRMGGGKKEYHKNLPENSLSALKASLVGVNGEKAIQYSQDFEYLEFDLHETYDGQIIILHDDDFTRVVLEKDNKAYIDTLLKSADVQKRVGKKSLKYKDLKTWHLTLSEIKKFKLEKTGESIPTIEEVFQFAQKWGLIKPMTIELKVLNTDVARKRLIDQAMQFRDQYLKKVGAVRVPKYDLPYNEVGFFAFSTSFKDSFGNKNFPSSLSYKQWCQYLYDRQFPGVTRPMTHQVNICDKYQ